MTWCAFLGDEVTAAGFRLAGVDVHLPSQGDAAALFDRLCTEARLIIVTAEIAAALPAPRIQAAQLADWPLVVVIPDIRGRVAGPDPVAALQRQLGLSE